MTRRVAIVGAGGIARSHARACREIPGARLVAVCDSRPGAAELFAAEFDVPATYASAGALLEAIDTLEVAIISTWGSTHLAVADALARSGKVRAILCEKPLAMNAAEAEAMAGVAAQHGVLLAEAFRLRHQPIHQEAIALLRAGRIGEIVHVREFMPVPVPLAERRPELNWRYRREAGGGATFDIGCYCIQHARWAMGAEPEVVQAFARWGDVSGVDEHVVATMIFPGERTAQWCASWDADGGQLAAVHGTHGSLLIPNAWGPDERQARTLEIRDLGGNVERLEFAPVSQLTLQLQHLFECLETGQPHRLPPSDSVAQMRVIDAVYASMRSGGAPVALARSSAAREDS